MITDDSSLLICAVAQARHPSLKPRESRRIDLVDADRRAKTALIFSHLMLPRFCWPRLLAAIIVSLSAVFGHDGAVSRQVPNLQPPAAVAATQPQAGSPLTSSQAVESRPFDDPKFPDEYDVAGGRFFLRTGDANGTGFSVTDAGDIPFWTFFNGFGGADRFGYPVSQRYIFGGLVMQAFQKSIFQWDAANDRVNFFNTLDELGNNGFNEFLSAHRQVPFPQDFPGEADLEFDGRAQLRLQLLEKDRAIEEVFFSNANWLDQYGLPTGFGESEFLVAIRSQRAVFQHWKVDGPWGPVGTVTIANAGDLAKESGFLPADLVASVPAPIPGSASRPVVVAADIAAESRIAEITAAIDGAYDYLWTTHAAWSKRPISVIVYGSREAFADLNYNPEFNRSKSFLRTVLGLHVREPDGMSSELRLNVQAIAESSGSIADTVTHEFVHALQSEILGIQRGADWIIEGMAEAVSLRAGNAPGRRAIFDTTFSDALINGSLPPLTALSNSIDWEAYGQSDAESRWLAQTAGYRAVAYLMDTFGAQVGFEILTRMRLDSLTLDQALRSVTGLNISGLDAQLRESAAAQRQIGSRPGIADLPLAA